MQYLGVTAILEIALSDIQVQDSHAQTPDVEAAVHGHASKLQQ